MDAPEPLTAVNTFTGQYRLEQDRSSGRFHKRYADEYGRFILTNEADNRDVSGAYDIRESTADASEDALCGNCFPAV